MLTASIDPRTGESFGPEFADTTTMETEAIISAASIAFQEWSQTSPSERARILDILSEALDAHKDELAELADRETALGTQRLTGEVGRTTFQIRSFARALRDPEFEAAEIDVAIDAPLPEGHPKFLRAKRAIGVVAVFGANNFPFAFSVLGGDTASALAAGCSAIIKFHPSPPQKMQTNFDISRGGVEMAGAPTSLISLGHGFEYGRAIVTDPRVNAAAFTGSREGGRALFDLAQSRANPIPFYGELGSINPVVALNSALAEPAIFAGAYLDSLLLGGGQFCTNPSLLFMPVNSDFLAEVETQIKHRAPQTLLSKSTKQMHESNRTALKVALNPRVFTGKEAPGVGFYSSPEVLVASASDIDAKELFATECFGPTGLIVTYQEISEVLNILKELDGALVGSLFALSSDKDAKSVTDSLANVCGRVTWNAWPTGVAVTSGQQHGGPYPASTSPLHTSVGVHAIERFLRPVTFQGFPDELMENA